jgi:hypothetical protein
MVWWFIGIWLASGALLPAFWLLSMAYRWVAPVACRVGVQADSALPSVTRVTTKLRRIDPHVVYGSVIVGTLIVVFAGSFSDLSPASAIAQASGTPDAVAEVRPSPSLDASTLALSAAQLSAKPVQADANGGEVVAPGGSLHEPPSPREARQAAPIPSPPDVVGASPGDAADQRSNTTVPQVPTMAALITSPVTHRALGAERGWGHHRARGPSAQPYVTPPSRGTWLFAPISNGANN